MHMLEIYQKFRFDSSLIAPSSNDENKLSRVQIILLDQGFLSANIKI